MTASQMSLLKNSQIVFDTKGHPSFALIPYELFHSLFLRKFWSQLKKLSPSEEETLEILSTPGLAVELLQRLASAKAGKTLSLKELKDEVYGQG